jgi:hypothetical protein
MNFTSYIIHHSNGTLTEKNNPTLEKGSKLRRQIIFHPLIYKQHSDDLIYLVMVEKKKSKFRLIVCILFRLQGVMGIHQEPKSDSQSQTTRFNLSCDYFQLNPSHTPRALSRCFSFSFITGKIHYREKISFKNIFLALRIMSLKII